MYKLTENDQEILIEMGVPAEDHGQIEVAWNGSEYTYFESGSVLSDNREKITPKRAIDLLGREVFLSGLARSAFHYTASRDANCGGQVLFDSSTLF